MKSKKLNRRQAIEAMLASPLSLYVLTKVSGFNFIANVHADGFYDQAFLDYKLINFSLNGGGARYYWDLPLRPNGASDFLEYNPCCITKYAQNTASDGIYDITQVGDYWMPSMWNNDIPVPGGRTSMKNLANHMLSIRGVFLPQGGHTFGRFSQMQPVSGKSLMGSIADVTSAPIASVTSGADSSFFISSKGLTPVNASNSNSDPLKRILASFIDSSTSRTATNASIEQAIDAALDVMKAESETKHKFLPTTYLDRVNAKKLMKKEFGDLQGIFDQKQQKYQDLIDKSLHDSSFNVTGVEDRAVIGDGSAYFNVGRQGGSAANVFYKGSDLRQIFQNCEIEFYSNHLAICEYMIEQGMTNTFSHSFSSLQNIQFQNLVYENGSGNFSGTGILNFDNHEAGSHIALLMYTKIYKAFSACNFELVNALKSNVKNGVSLFDKSLITLTGDFNRQARIDGSGSDHGADGTNYTILSGMVPKLTVIGNTSQYLSSNPSWNKWRGSWGVASELEEIGSKKINFGNIASTIAAMTETESLANNEMSLVRKENGKVVPITERPKNIAS